MQTKCVVISGLAGVGKSTIAGKVSNRLNFSMLDKDTLCETMVEELLIAKKSYPGDRESDIYRNQINPLEYEILMKVAAENLNLGNSVVLVAPFLHRLIDKDWFKDNLFSKVERDFDLKMVYVQSDESSEYKRIILRGEERDSWKINNWELYAKDVEVFRNTTIFPKNTYFFPNTSVNDGLKGDNISALIKWIME